MSIIVVTSRLIFYFAFGIINFYIGSRVFDVFGRMLPAFNPLLYWIAFWIVSLSYLIAILARKLMPRVIENILIWVGNYWLGAMAYLIMFLVLFDVLFLITRGIDFLPFELGNRDNFHFITGIIALFLVAGLLVYGSWNARNSKVTTYNIQINKSAGGIKSLKAVMVSDLHLGDIVDNRRLDKMVQRINELDPDIIFLGGDIIDEDPEPFERQNMSQTLLKLRSKYGVYGVLGNHEYARGQVEKIIEDLEKSGIRILRDDYIKLNDSIYIAGRDDSSRRRFLGESRKTLQELLSGVDKNSPIILLDHQPRGLEESFKNRVDIQLSGHNHGGGQIFPDNFITERIYELTYGYLERENTHVFVTSGYGTWGPPLRIGNRSEILELNIKFKD